MIDTKQSRNESALPALGYVKESFTDASPALQARQVTIEKSDEGPAWGAVYAQYVSPVSEVSGQGGALSVERRLFVERTGTDGRKQLLPLQSSASMDAELQVGDVVVSRLTIRLDRNMDFLQLKERRAACLEPLGALSGYRWDNGIGYYREVEDAAVNYFFDHLGKGVYVLEHSYCITHSGVYQMGLATLQCAYAPELVSHSGATARLSVGKK